MEASYPFRASRRGNERFLRVNVALEPDFVETYAITGTPTLVMFRDGNVVGRAEGPHPAESIIVKLLAEAFEMPDGSKKCGGEAVAEVFRSLPNTRWFTASFGWSVFGFRPFQTVLNAGYTLLSDVRPLLGCESCGTPNAWVKAVRDPLERAMVAIGRARKSKRTAHFTPSAPRTVTGTARSGGRTVS